jgi:hypothetical protein
MSVAGFAEGAGAIFLGTEAAGMFTVELRSCRTKKVHRDTFDHKVMPYESFFYIGGTYIYLAFKHLD